MINKIEIICENQESIIQTSEELAKHLFNQVLCVGQAKYLLMDFEFYIKTKNTDLFKDEYVYTHEQQLKKGFLFSHKSGFDITWGNDELYVGILIRSLAKLYDNTPHPDRSFLETYKIQKYIMGPNSVADEIINQFNVLENSAIRFEEKHTAGIEDSLKTPHYSKTKRVGLPVKDFKDADYFRNLNFRHIAFLPYKLMKELNPVGNVKNITNIIINDFINKEKNEENKALIRLILNSFPTALK